MTRAKTLGELRATGYTQVPVKQEIRRNIITKLRNKESLFPGVIGYEETVIPHVVNALLASHDILLLGLRGQAKTRLARALPSFLDEAIPIIRGSEINDDPTNPISFHATQLVQEMGNETPIEWIGRAERYSEKLATPDVSTADLIGDIDPIKAATQRLHYSHEGAMHFGIVPRSNRGIFVINELPDLQPRIQVALFNVLQERDVQIRGFNVRMPMDLLIVFTANPEDYTNRGAIITPLKDRIQSQIHTHYPRTLEEGMQITEQEARYRRHESTVMVHDVIHQVIECIAIIARTSEFVDQASGVSARLTISTLENTVANAERRSIRTGSSTIVPRLCDVARATPGITGKIELVFEGEQEGPLTVARALMSKAVREVFKLHYPDPNVKRSKKQQQEYSDPYAAIVRWFEAGNSVTISDSMSDEEFYNALSAVPMLEHLTTNGMDIDASNTTQVAVCMEFVLDALHQHSRIGKSDDSISQTYKDLVGSMLRFSVDDEL